MPKYLPDISFLNKLAKKRGKHLKAIAKVQKLVDAIDSQVEAAARALGFGGGEVGNPLAAKRGRTAKSKTAEGTEVGNPISKRRKKRKMSAEGRARIIAAQKKRWAKTKAAKK